MAADPTANWFESAVDRVVSIFAPKKAVARRHFRRLERDADYREAVGIGLRMRGYRAARNTDNQTPWRSMDMIGRPADTEVLWDLPILRNRSRELNRDDPIGSGLTNEFTLKIIGPGLDPQARTDSTLKNTRIEKAFDKAAENLSPADGLPYGALQQMRCHKLLEDGDIFVKMSVIDDVMVSETVEADRVQTPMGGNLVVVPEGSRVVDGIEKDRNGFPTHIWVRKHHAFQQHVKTAPLADTTMMGVSFNKDDFERVPVDQIKHVKLADRPGQTRGVPFLHAVMQDLHDLDLLILASLKRMQLAACLAVFIETIDDLAEMLPATAQTYGFEMDMDLQPGMVFRLLPGEKVSYLNPNLPTQDLDTFITSLAKRIGASIGVSWQTVLHDWSQSNYSSARQQILDDRPTFTKYRNMLKPLFAWERKLTLEHAVLRGDVGRISEDDIDAVEFLDPRQPWIDPEKDAKAIALQLELGLTTKQIEAAALHRDWEEMLEQTIRERLLAEKLEAEIREEMGLPTPEEKAASMAEAQAGPDEGADADSDDFGSKGEDGQEDADDATNKAEAA